MVRGDLARAMARPAEFFGLGSEVRRARSLDWLDPAPALRPLEADRKSTRLNSSHGYISYAVFCLKKKKKTEGQIIFVSPSSRHHSADGRVPQQSDDRG